MADSNFSFGGVSIPSDAKRLYVTAVLAPTMSDPRIQPTKFPDIDTVMYPDPSGEHGQICLIESEPSMANHLEEVAFADKYTGTLLPELTDLPYIKVVKGERFMTSSTIDAHRFASKYVLEAKIPAANGAIGANSALVDYLKKELGVESDDAKGKHVPAPNIPRIFRLAMELDPMSLIHGFQIASDKLTFVGLRSPRALTGCIVGLNAQPVGVPGIAFNPLATAKEAEGYQPIFRKERIVAETIQANFAIDLGLLIGLPVGTDSVNGEKTDPAEKRAEVSQSRIRLLVALALWKVAKFLKDLSSGRRLRSECDLVLDRVFYSSRPIRLPASEDTAQQAKSFTQKLVAANILEFPFEQIVTDAAKKNGDKPANGSLQDLIAKAKFPANRSPLILEFGG
jgi:CRISPR-associated protein Csb1